MRSTRGDRVVEGENDKPSEFITMKSSNVGPFFKFCCSVSTLVLCACGGGGGSVLLDGTCCAGWSKGSTRFSVQ